MQMHPMRPEHCFLSYQKHLELTHLLGMPHQILNLKSPRYTTETKIRSKQSVDDKKIGNGEKRATLS